MLKIIIAVILLVGCAGTPISQVFEPTTIRNTDCYESPYLKVMQVLDDGILAYLCPTNYPSYYDSVFDACNIKGDLVFLSVPKKKNYFVDDQKVELPSDSCFVPSGVYSYATREKIKKTVRLIGIEDAYLPNPNLPKNPELKSGEGK